MTAPPANSTSLRRLSPVLILFWAVALTAPIAFYGFPRGNDLPQHFQFAQTYSHSIQTGEFAPPWSPTTNHGFGDVGVRFYPPLSYWLLAGLHSLSLTWFQAAASAVFLWFFIGGLGIYLWLNEHFDGSAALLAAIIYMAAPYHVNQVYNASFLAEFAAAGVLPFCFLFASRVCRSRNFTDVGLLASSYSLLVLTHLPTAMIGSAGLLIFSAASIPKAARISALVRLTLAVGIGLLLSAFYWARMLPDLAFLNHTASEFVSRAYDFRLNFVGSYFYVNAQTYNDRFLWFSDLMAVVTAGMVVPSIAFYFADGEGRSALLKKAVPAGLVLLSGVLLATPLSSTAWENIPTLQKIQFPFRWLVLINLAGVYFVAAGFANFSRSFATPRRPLCLAAAGLMLIGVAFSATQIIRPAVFIPANEFNVFVGTLTDEVSYKCWWPVWAREGALTEPASGTNADGGSSGGFTRDLEREFEIELSEPSTARVGMFYYPNWKAEVDGDPLPVTHDENGVLTVDLPAGRSRVRIYWQETGLTQNTRGISAVSWLVLLLALGIATIRKYVYHRSDRKLV